MKSLQTTAQYALCITVNVACLSLVGGARSYSFCIVVQCNVIVIIENQQIGPSELSQVHGTKWKLDLL